jgi:hypothetical protein
LYRLSNRRLAELGAMRAARLYSIGMAVSFGVLTLVSDAEADTARVFVEQALVSASWAVAGLSMFAATRDLEKRDAVDGITALVAARGHDFRARARMRSVSLAVRVAVGVSLPALCVVLLASGQNPTPWSVRFVAFVIAYAVLLGTMLAALYHLFARWAPRSLRVVVLASVLGPELLRLSMFPRLPSLPAAFAWIIEQSERLGGALG